MTGSLLEIKDILSWTKVLAPLELFQKMHHFSQKSVAVTNILVYTFISLKCIGLGL